MKKKGHKKQSVGDKQASIVMKTFAAGKLRDRSGKTITDPKRAKAVAMSEKRAAEKHGVSERTFKGRTRIRPKLKKK
jgi:chorismate mutase